MKTFIIAALSADGFIARSTTELADWTSKEDKKLFVELTKRAGVMIMGRQTYETIGKPLPGRRTIVYSRSGDTYDGVDVTSEDPATLLAGLASEGYDEVAICGGRSIYDLFLRSGLVDELYLTIEPVLFGEGIQLCGSPIETQLKLLDSRQLNENTQLLHYEVKR
jgi:dihydrofolate reductase